MPGVDPMVTKGWLPSAGGDTMNDAGAPTSCTNTRTHNLSMNIRSNNASTDNDTNTTYRFEGRHGCGRVQGRVCVRGGRKRDRLPRRPPLHHLRHNGLNGLLVIHEGPAHQFLRPFPHLLQADLLRHLPARLDDRAAHVNGHGDAGGPHRHRGCHARQLTLHAGTHTRRR